MLMVMFAILFDCEAAWDLFITLCVNSEGKLMSMGSDFYTLLQKLPIPRIWKEANILCLCITVEVSVQHRLYISVHIHNLLMHKMCFCVLLFVKKQNSCLHFYDNTVCRACTLTLHIHM